MITRSDFKYFNQILGHKNILNVSQTNMLICMIELLNLQYVYKYLSIINTM